MKVVEVLRSRSPGLSPAGNILLKTQKGPKYACGVVFKILCHFGIIAKSKGMTYD